MKPRIMQTASNIVIGLGLLTGIWCYLQGAPGWLVLVTLAGVPLVAWGVSRMAGTELWRRYRFLLYIVGMAILCGGFEAWQHRKIPKSVLKPLDISAGPGEPDLFLDYDLPGTLTRVFPQRAEALFMRGFQLKLCFEDQLARRPSRAVCAPFREITLPEIRQYFEQALAKQTKIDENLYYYYVEVLLRLDAPQGEIDAAAQEWKRLFPRSLRRDPREEFAAARPGRAMR